MEVNTITVIAGAAGTLGLGAVVPAIIKFFQKKGDIAVNRETDQIKFYKTLFKEQTVRHEKEISEYKELLNTQYTINKENIIKYQKIIDALKEQLKNESILLSNYRKATELMISQLLQEGNKSLVKMLKVLISKNEEVLP